jgi:DNA invertase Pin-like site-specific DNA recombinase
MKQAKTSRSEWRRPHAHRKAKTRDDAARPERAFIYVRAANVEDVHNVGGEQLRSCRDYAARAGIAVAIQAIDAPASGMSDDRPGFAALLAAVSAGGIDVVLVEDLMRISRSAATIDYFMELAVRSGVRVVEVGADVFRRVHEDYAAGRNLNQIARIPRLEGVSARQRRRAS